MRERSKDDAWPRVQAAISGFTEGASVQDILDHLDDSTPRRTLQYWLKQWVGQGHLRRSGERRSVRYFLAANALDTSYNSPPHNHQPDSTDTAKQAHGLEAQGHDFPFSEAALKTLGAIRKPRLQRPPVGYNFAFLNGYRPNETTYLNAAERAHLTQLSQPMRNQPAGTYARQLLNRLLIDLSWNSSRLEGNTYSLLDTRRLIAFGAEAEGKAKLETQMIINHKDAIEFLVESAEEIDLNRYTLLNLHANGS